MTKETLRAYLPMKRELAQIHELIAEVEEGRYSPKNGLLIIKATELFDAGGDVVALYKQKAAALEAQLLEIESAVNALPPTERTIIRWHFIKGLTWRQVAEKENYCSRHVRRLCDKALTRLAGVAE